MEWNAAAKLALNTCIHAGMTYEQIAKEFGVSRSAIAGAVRRYVNHREDAEAERIRKRQQAQSTHYGMIEPWRVYTARKQKERAEARAAALQVTSTGPRQEAD